MRTAGRSQVASTIPTKLLDALVPNKTTESPHIGMKRFASHLRLHVSSR